MPGDPIARFKGLIANKGKRKACIQLAPAVRVAVGEEFGLPPGTDLTKELIWSLRKMGADYVFDTPLGADIIAIEEANELKETLEKGGPFPIFNSCCIGWMEYIRRMHPEIKSNMTPLDTPHMVLVSPQMALGGLIKTYFKEEMGLGAEPLVISIMPCVLKEKETEFKMENGQKYVDAVFTTREIAQVLKGAGIDLNKAKESEFDELEAAGSGEGLGFGASGGVGMAVLQNLARMLGAKVDIIELDRKEGEVEGRALIGKYDIRFAFIYGLQNAQKIIEEVKNGKKFHLIEVMACPGGCVGGSGQPMPMSPEKTKERAESLKLKALGLKQRASLDNPAIKDIYSYFFGKIGSEKARKLLHVANRA